MDRAHRMHRTHGNVGNPSRPTAELLCIHRHHAIPYAAVAISRGNVHIIHDIHVGMVVVSAARPAMVNLVRSQGHPADMREADTNPNPAKAEEPNHCRMPVIV